jgi:recombination endonuclease VII
MTTTKQFLATVQRKYGLAPDEYRALHYAQGGKCYVCRKATGKARRLGVDHDHLTGEVRGLVCTGSINAMTCNRLIAIYGREQLLRAAVMLSDPPPARAVLARIRSGDNHLPSMIDATWFYLPEVGGVDVG